MALELREEEITFEVEDVEAVPVVVPFEPLEMTMMPAAPMMPIAIKITTIFLPNAVRRESSNGGLLKLSFEPWFKNLIP